MQTLGKDNIVALKCSKAEKMLLTGLRNGLLLSLAHFPCAILNYTENYKEDTWKKRDKGACKGSNGLTEAIE